MSQKMIYKSGKEQIVFDAWEKNKEFEKSSRAFS